MPPATQIIGLGSPQGDDAVGWLLVERLRSRGVRAALQCVRTAVDLADHVRGGERLIIADSCRGGLVPGTIVRLEWPDSRILQQQARSSHGLTLGEVLQLLESLGRLPQEVIIYGVELETCQPEQRVSNRVLAALDDLERRILREGIG